MELIRRAQRDKENGKVGEIPLAPRWREREFG
jgi:hypothetical protein